MHLVFEGERDERAGGGGRGERRDGHQAKAGGEANYLGVFEEDIEVAYGELGISVLLAWRERVGDQT